MLSLIAICIFFVWSLPCGYFFSVVSYAYGHVGCIVFVLGGDFPFRPCWVATCVPLCAVVLALYYLSFSCLCFMRRHEQWDLVSSALASWLSCIVILSLLGHYL